MDRNKLSTGAFSHLEVIYLIPLPHPHPMTQHKGAPLLPCPAQVQAGHNRGQLSPDKPQPVLRRRGLGGWRRSLALPGGVLAHFFTSTISLILLHTPLFPEIRPRSSETFS